jgi:hypothetical protein
VSGAAETRPLLEHTAPVVFHADDGPAELLGVGERLLTAAVGELALVVVMVEEQREPGRFQHLDVDVPVAGGEQGQPAGRSEDVLRFSGADVETADSVLTADDLAVREYSAAVPITFSLKIPQASSANTRMKSRPPPETTNTRNSCARR